MPPSSDPSDNSLNAGVARRLINPSRDIPLSGYAGRVQGNIGIHDDLTVTALALRVGMARACILSLDHTFINARVVAQIRSQVNADTGIAQDAVMVCCSHSHSGPLGYADETSPAEHRQYIAFLVDQLAAAVAEAIAHLQPVELRVGRDHAEIGINRRERLSDGRIIIGRNPSGICDTSLQVLQVVSGDRPLAVLVNYACHPVIMGPDNRLASADWVGAMRRTFEAQTGTLCLFAQGAAADINPRHMQPTEGTWETVESQGVLVAQAVQRALQNTQPLTADSLVAVQETCHLPLLRHANRAGLAGFLPSGLSDEQVNAIIRKEFPWHTQVDETDSGRTSPVTVSIIRVGDFALVGLETEPFTQTGLTIKASSPAPLTMVAGYTNGCNSYLPPRDAYADGGYEVETASLFYGLPAPFAPGGEEQVTAVALRLLKDSG